MELFWVPFVAFFLFWLARIAWYRGMTGAVLGARVARTIGELDGQSALLISPTLTVFKLESERGSVGLVVRYGWDAGTPIVFTNNEVEYLIGLLKQASSGADA